MAKFTVKSVQAERDTNYGHVCDVILHPEEGPDVLASVWRKVKIGDVLYGELGRYDEKYKKYKFKVSKVEGSKIEHPAPDMDEKDKRITMLSLLNTGASFEKEEGAIFAFMEVAFNRIYNGKYILLCSAEQRKKIVAKYGNIEQARWVAYGLFKKPYLHLLTTEEAEQMLSEDKNDKNK